MLNSLKAKIAKNKETIITAASYTAIVAVVAGLVYASVKMEQAVAEENANYIDSLNAGLADGSLVAYANELGEIHIIPNIFDNASN